MLCLCREKTVNELFQLYIM